MEEVNPKRSFMKTLLVITSLMFVGCSSPVHTGEVIGLVSGVSLTETTFVQGVYVCLTDHGKSLGCYKHSSVYEYSRLKELVGKHVKMKYEIHIGFIQDHDIITEIQVEKE
jgi:hypothetical protein